MLTPAQLAKEKTMKTHTTIAETYDTQERAELAVKGWKLMMPFRNWCAVKLPAGWHVCSSIRQAKKEMRNAGVTSADTLTFGRD